MNRQICPMILDTDTLSVLSDDIIKEFVIISNSTIVKHVELFISRYQSEFPELAKKLQTLYKPYYDAKAELNEESYQDILAQILNTEPEALSFDMGKEALQTLLNTVDSILDKESLLVNRTGEFLLQHTNKMLDIAHSQFPDDAKRMSVVIDFVDAIVSKQRLFVNKGDNSIEYSKLYRVLRCKDKIVKIQSTLNALLEQYERSSGAEVIGKWRHI